MKDLFDLKNNEDLPGVLQIELKKGYVPRERVIRLLELFTFKNDLTIDEMLVGLFRKFNIVEKRIWLRQTCSRLEKDGKLIRLEWCRYKLKNPYFKGDKK